MELRPLIPLRDLRTLRGSFAELTDPAHYLGTPREDYLQILLTDEEDIPEAIGQLRVIYPNIMKLGYDNTRTRANRVLEAVAEVERKSPLELFGELYETQNNRPMSLEQEHFVRELIESIWEEQL